uniref:IRG-type G domain-containing protein n=1 Tax=Cyprinodon variegatus TaxID=28743 RepID=A0A3Q2DKY7_CYPVA
MIKTIELIFRIIAITTKLMDSCCALTALPTKICSTYEVLLSYFRFSVASEGLYDSAVPAGVIEITKEAIDYRHPKYPNVILRDFPVIGTPASKAEDYLKDVGCKTENYGKLAQETLKNKKRFYFVHLNIDNNFQDWMSLINFPFNFTMKLRSSCCKSPEVFLVSNPEIHLYDFDALIKAFERHLPKNNMDAQTLSPDFIMKKKEIFQRVLWGLTALSGVAAAVPVPGLSAAVDLSLLVGTVTYYVSGFGLDIPSLKRLSVRTGLPYDELKAVLKSHLFGVEITKDLIKKITAELSFCASLEVVEEGSRFIPIIGSAIAFTLSAVLTYKLLNKFLDLLAEDALRLHERVLKNRQ